MELISLSTLHRYNNRIIVEPVSEYTQGPRIPSTRILILFLDGFACARDMYAGHGCSLRAFNLYYSKSRVPIKQIPIQSRYPGRCCTLKRVCGEGFRAT